MAVNRKQPPSSGKQPSPPPNPAHYPPDRLPALTTAELQAISQKPLPTKQELETAQSERRRAVEKIEWAAESGRPDSMERIASATATTRTTLSLDPLAAQGLDYRERQKAKAAHLRPRNDPLDRAIVSLLRGNPKAPACDVWNALSGYQDSQDCDLKVVEEGGFLKSRYWVDGQERSGTPITFDTFAVRVSRLRKLTSKRG